MVILVNYELASEKERSCTEELRLFFHATFDPAKKLLTVHSKKTRKEELEELMFIQSTIMRKLNRELAKNAAEYYTLVYGVP